MKIFLNFYLKKFRDLIGCHNFCPLELFASLTGMVCVGPVFCCLLFACLRGFSVMLVRAFLVSFEKNIY